MQTYFVRSVAVSAGATGLGAALMRLRESEDIPETRARWLRSYVVREPDGRFGLACLMEAEGTAAVEDHAARVHLPTHEIAPVAGVLPVRPFAPALAYMVRRRGAWHSAEEFDRCASQARRVADEQMANEVRWLHSYLLREGDGSLGSLCFCQGLHTETLRQHAARCAIPAHEVVQVVGRVVFREDA